MTAAQRRFDGAAKQEIMPTQLAACTGIATFAFAFFGPSPGMHLLTWPRIMLHQRHTRQWRAQHSLCSWHPVVFFRGFQCMLLVSVLDGSGLSPGIVVRMSWCVGRLQDLWARAYLANAEVFVRAMHDGPRPSTGLKPPGVSRPHRNL